MTTPKVRTLRRVVETLGGEKQAADALAVTPEELARWLSGEPLPDDVYLRALDIVANGPRAT